MSQGARPIIAFWIILILVALTAIVVYTIRWNRRWDVMQRVRGQERPSLSLEAFAAELAKDGVDPAISAVLYTDMLPLCSRANILPHPDDALMGFYFDDPEDLEDYAERWLMQFDAVPCNPGDWRTLRDAARALSVARRS